MRKLIAAVVVATVIAAAIENRDSPKQHERDTLGQSLFSCLAPGSRFAGKRIELRSRRLSGTVSKKPQVLKKGADTDDAASARYLGYMNYLAKIKARTEEKYYIMTAAELKDETKRLMEAVKAGVRLEAVLVDAFAIFKVAADRIMPSINPNYAELHDEQILAAIAMATGYYEGREKSWVLAEQASGEGKSLTIAMVAYLWALTEGGVHVGTFNDYLAVRDCMQMGRIFDILGISVSAIQADGSNLICDERCGHIRMRQYWPNRMPVTRRDAYRTHITYGWWASFAHDYLYDSIQPHPTSASQRGFNALILDEADDPLADEARVPLVLAERLKISQTEKKERTGRFYSFKEIAASLKEGTDFTINRRERTIALRKELQGENAPFIINALLAKHVLRQNIDYIIKDSSVIVIDRPTGRRLPLHTWDDGLHEAVEAENGLEIRDPLKDVASTNFSDFFSRYKRKAAITATAKPIRDEARRRYKLCYIPFPLHDTNRRIDLPEVVFRTKEEKWLFVAELARHASNPTSDASPLAREIIQSIGPRPVLIGTTNIKDSLTLSRIFNEKDISHNLLNGFQDTGGENELIRQAGTIDPRRGIGNIMIATNMAGRGTDIIVDKRSIQNGGLLVIGTEHYESERQDGQLRGRAARQGQPGSSIFITSLEDEPIQRFAVPWLLSKVWHDLRNHKGGLIHHPQLKEIIETARVTAEDYHRSLREHTLGHFHIRDVQRTLFYQLRQRLIEDMAILGDEAALDKLIAQYSISEFENTDIYTDEPFTDELLLNRVKCLTTKEGLEEFSRKAKGELAEMLNLYWMAYAGILEAMEKKAAPQAIDRYKASVSLSWRLFIEGLRQFRTPKTDAVPLQKKPRAGRPVKRETFLTESIRLCFEIGVCNLREISEELHLPNRYAVVYLVSKDEELRAMRDAKLAELIGNGRSLPEMAAVFGLSETDTAMQWIRSNEGLNKAYEAKPKARAKRPDAGISRDGKQWASPHQKRMIMGFFKGGIYNWQVISSALSVEKTALTSFVIRDDELLQMRNSELIFLIAGGQPLKNIAHLFGVDIATIDGWIRSDPLLSATAFPNPTLRSSL